MRNRDSPWEVEIERPERQTDAAGRESALQAAGGGAVSPKCLSVKDVVEMIAKFGGFLGRKSSGEPGANVLWRGMAKLQIYAQAWIIFKQEDLCG
jgi:hypothetical protein